MPGGDLGCPLIFSRLCRGRHCGIVFPFGCGLFHSSGLQAEIGNAWSINIRSFSQVKVLRVHLLCAYRTGILCARQQFFQSRHCVQQ